VAVGSVIEVEAGAPLPEEDDPVLYVLMHPVGSPAALAAKLAR
jgi:hypothetical protein